MKKTKKTKKIIHYALVLDQSGSMEFLKKEVVSSFNEQVDLIMKLREENEGTDIKVTLCVFNSKVDFKYTGEDVDNLGKLTMKDYCPNSTTALYDAMGQTMLRLQETKKPEDKVFLAVFTDGLENSSREYSAADIRSKVKQAEKDGWEIRFFNRHEDHGYYKRELDFSDKMQFNVPLNDEGLRTIEEQVRYNINQLIKD